MKLTKLANLMLLGAALTFAAGCHNHQVYGPTPIPGQAHNNLSNPGSIEGGNPVGQPPPIGTENNPTGTGLPPNGGDSHPGWHQDTNTLASQTVYFDFDKSAIKSSEESKIQAVADYLKNNAQAAVRVEGNCDERGTEEYNRSLGERRALAAREHLVALGIDSTRVDTISYGEDRPVDAAHGEEAWSKNRRDDFVVLTPP